MSLFVASLNSGSNGNCYYVGNDQEAVLIDAGISCREIERRMGRLNLDMQKIKAIFISHEHTDHIRGLDVLARKYNLPVYITTPTLSRCPFYIDKSSAISFTADQTIEIGDLAITPFAKQHDAIDPYSFIVEGNGIKVGVITDIGIACKQVVHYFKQCHAAFLESNYDVKMLEEGNYPYSLKKRIHGSKGHLSNDEALHLFLQHRPVFMSHLFLSHLSRENNSPERVSDLFNKHAGNVNIVVASRYKETSVYAINNEQNLVSRTRTAIIQKQAAQMSLFE